MKRKFALTVALCFVVIMLCSCARTGERDRTDFIADMAKYGFDLSAEEIVSSDALKESYYINGCKISVCINENSKLCRLILTYGISAPEDFLNTAVSCIMSFCGYEEALTEKIVCALGFSAMPPSSTVGVNRCESGYFLFSFTADKAGGCLIIDNLRLNPTSSPSVTVRTTVPEIVSSEETASS